MRSRIVPIREPVGLPVKGDSKRMKSRTALSHGMRAGQEPMIQAGAPQPAKPADAPGNDFLPPLLTLLLKTAQLVIDRHVNDHGFCAACGSAAYPCKRAMLADLALSAL